MTAEYRKPLPVADHDTRAFWDSAREHRLRLPRCRACGRAYLPPSPQCRSCWSTDVEWIEASGRGRLYSWVTVHQAYDPSFQEDLPYTIAIVELEEGPRLLTSIVGVDAARLRVDLPVTIVYDDVTPEWTLPKFREVE